jgi:hypothetical protein
MIYSKNGRGMSLLKHNRVDVRTRVKSLASAEQWHLKKIPKPHLQHGTCSFFFCNGDDNPRRS